jgi:predicted lipoprotein
MQLLLVDFATKHDSVSDWQAQIKAMPALSLESSREQVELVKNFAEALAKFVEIELAPSLNIYLGFNNFDGD